VDAIAVAPLPTAHLPIAPKAIPALLVVDVALRRPIRLIAPVRVRN
jgi:hypothetical protein